MDIPNDYDARGEAKPGSGQAGVPAGFALGVGWLTTGIGTCLAGRHKVPDARNMATFVHDDGRGCCREHAVEMGALVPLAPAVAEVTGEAPAPAPAPRLLREAVAYSCCSGVNGDHEVFCTSLSAEVLRALQQPTRLAMQRAGAPVVRKVAALEAELTTWKDEAALRLAQLAEVRAERDYFRDRLMAVERERDEAFALIDGSGSRCAWCRTVGTLAEVAAHATGCLGHPLARERDAARAEAEQLRAPRCSTRGGDVSAALRPVLDACCGPRMFWFDKADKRALFVDNRRENHTVTDRSHGKAGGVRSFSIQPDMLASFEALPFEDGTFPLVVFDPPHINHGGAGIMVKKYGLLKDNWREVLRHGFGECFRVLHPLGTLVFKWSECDIPVREILALTDRSPLFGQRCGAKARTHWIVFMKPTTTETGVGT